MIKISEINRCYRCSAIFEEPKIQMCSRGPHHATVRCPACDYFLGFMPKPENKEKLEKRPEKCTPEEMGIDWCQICLRKEDELGKGWLCVHHIDDDPTNNERLNKMVVCIACHKLISWTRTYMKDHFNG